MTTVTTTSPALTVTHLTKRYANADRDVLNDISFDVPRGRVMVIVGPSGSGKSTLLRAVAGLEPIQDGTISLDGTVIGTGQADTTRRPRRSAQVRTKIGMVFQSYDLFADRTALDNIMLAPILVQKRNRADVKREALALLERVGLADRAQARPHELSGGQRQRVAICRALIMHPEVLLLDEITAALDPEMVHEVLDVVVSLADRGQTMLIVTHEMQFARAVADSIMFLEDGRIVERSEDPATFFEHPNTPRAQQFLSTFTFTRRRKDHDTAVSTDPVD